MSANFSIVTKIDVTPRGIMSSDKMWELGDIRVAKPFADRSFSNVVTCLVLGTAALAYGGTWGILGGLALWAFTGYTAYNPMWYAKVTLVDGHDLWVKAVSREDAKQQADAIMKAKAQHG